MVAALLLESAAEGTTTASGSFFAHLWILTMGHVLICVLDLIGFVGW
jgi:hypothetical protein